MNPSIRIGGLGVIGGSVMFAFAMKSPFSLYESLALFAMLGAAFGFLGYVSLPKGVEAESVPAETDNERRTRRLIGEMDDGFPRSQGVTLDELKVSTETAKDLAKSRSGGDLAFDAPGVSLRLGERKGELMRPSDDGSPSTIEIEEV